MINKRKRQKAMESIVKQKEIIRQNEIKLRELYADYYTADGKTPDQIVRLVR